MDSENSLASFLFSSEEYRVQEMEEEARLQKKEENDGC